MNKIKRLLCILIVGLLIFSCLTACNNSSILKIPFDKNFDESIESSVIATNKNFELSWNDDAKCVSLKNISSGKIWSTIPYEYYLSGGSSANVNSTFNITVSNTTSLKWDSVNGYLEAFTDGRITSQKSKNGIKVTYYFDKYKISVPIEYKLRKDAMEISINPKEISEGNEYKLVSVSPVPFLCSAVNGTSDSYLFVPTGSGALMYTDERLEGDRVYTGEVYGEDASRLLTDNNISEEPIRMPVYGVRDKDNAMLGVIESGAESAYIDAMAGNSRTGYSNIYASFYLRSYDKEHSGVQSLNFADIIKVSEEISLKPVKIAFYPLSGTEANYMGMVKRYKSYLEENGSFKKEDTSTSTFGLNIYGGVLVNTSILGIPSQRIDVLTTFSDALSMIKELSSISDMKPEVILRGFGESGINIGKIAGGFDFPSAFGSKDNHRELEDYCKENDYSIYTDFDTIRFNSSGNGFNYLFNSAKSPSLQTVNKVAKKTPYNDNEKNKYRLLKRDELSTAVNKVLKFANKEKISGIGLSTLSDIVYSDYSNPAYYSCGNMSEDVKKMLNNVRKSNHNIAVSSANDYASAVANAVFNVPINNGDYNVFDSVLPFYEMVFEDSKHIYSNAVNSSSDIQKQIMLTLSGGARLSFDLINNIDTSDLVIQTERLYSSVYSKNRSQIKNILKKYAPICNAIAGEGITDYEIKDKSVSKTTFENGIVLYANHSADKVFSPVGEIDAYGIIMLKE